MPRNDGKHPEPSRIHHKRMHSARKGRGLDAKIRKRKRAFGGRGRCPECSWPTTDVSRHARINHPRKN